MFAWGFSIVLPLHPMHVACVICVNFRGKDLANPFENGVVLMDGE